jgi:hypothetical protein
VSLLSKAKSYLTGRAQAYRRTFDPESVAAQAVLRDLAKFCRGTESTFHPDPRVHALLEGRKEVLLRIQNHLDLSPDKLWEIYGRKDLTNDDT